MGFWIFMLVMDLLFPVIMIVMGRYFMKTSPKEINYIFGYRTNMSMKNKDTWDFAHKYIGRLWFYLGLLLIPITVIPMLFVLGGTEGMYHLCYCLDYFDRSDISNRKSLKNELRQGR